MMRPISHIGLIGLISLIGLIGLTAHAASAPELMLTWRASAYAPPAFTGKILPPPGAEIEVAASLIDNGKIVTLAPYEVRWKVNGIARSAQGLQTIRFPAAGGGIQEVEVTVLRYKGTTVRGSLEIPVATPELVIAPSLPDHALQPNLNIFRALLYFFTINSPADSRIIWSAAGNSTQGGESDQEILELDIGENPASGAALTLTVTAENIRNPLETGRSIMQLIVP